MAAVVIAAVLWSTSFAVTKVVLADVGELVLGAARFLLAAALLLLLCLLRSKSLRAAVRVHAFVALTGLVGVTAYFALENYGVALASATDATLIVASYPVLMIGAEAIAGRTRFNGLRLLGALIALGGVALVVTGSPARDGSNRVLGVALLLVGGGAWVAFNLLSASRRRGELSVESATLIQNFWGGIGFCALIPLLPEGPTRASLSGSTVVLIAYLGAGCSAAAFLLYSYGLRGLAPSQAVGLLNLVPVFGLLSAVAIAREPLTASQAIGAFVVVLGVSLNARRVTTTPKPAHRVTRRSLIPSSMRLHREVARDY